MVTMVEHISLHSISGYETMRLWPRGHKEQHAQCLQWICTATFLVNLKPLIMMALSLKRFGGQHDKSCRIKIK